MFCFDVSGTYFILVLSLKVVHILLFYYSTLLKNPFDTDRRMLLKHVGRAANHQSDRQEKAFE